MFFLVSAQGSLHCIACDWKDGIAGRPLLRRGAVTTLLDNGLAADLGPPGSVAVQLTTVVRWRDRNLTNTISPPTQQFHLYKSYVQPVINCSNVLRCQKINVTLIVEAIGENQQTHI